MTGRSTRYAHAPWPAALPAALAAIAVLFSACSGGAPRPEAAPAPEPGFQLAPGGTLVLAVDASGGLYPLPPPETGSVPAEPVSEPFPIAVSAATIQPIIGGAVVAINRKGLSRLTIRRSAPDVAASVLIEPIDGAAAEFDGRTVAPSWGSGGDAVFLLYRHPVYELAERRSPASVTIAATLDRARIVRPGLGDDAFAAYPRAPGEWLAQYRTETTERVTTAYARLSLESGEPETIRTSPVTREDFERLVAPEPMERAPEALRAAVAAIGGPVLLEARLPDGSRRAFVRGDPGQAAPAWGHLYGDRACVATDDWRVVLADGASGVIVDPSPVPPYPGATVRDAVLLEDALILLWEAGSFPYLWASGLVILDAPRK
ncbi:MAG TPA: hypothetical protein PLE25_01030 [Spirochaetales bacterium]|nr:hypothetical protein [Spirochaetales bacterium]